MSQMWREMKIPLFISTTLSLLFLGCGLFGWFYCFFLAIFFLLFDLFILYFARDPDRDIPQGIEIILAPADGRVIQTTEHKNGFSIAIYLSLFDVHINRIPCEGVVTGINYNKGHFNPAFSETAGLQNECLETEIKNRFGNVKVRQIAGILARRIVSNLSTNDHVKAGDVFGMIRFGSRVEVDLPINTEVLVNKGECVRAGENIIARFL